MRNIVLLGASNLTQSFPRIVGRLRAAWEEPVAVYAAHGHGRSYGRWSHVLVRSLPAINTCRLWDDLDRVDTGSSLLSALVTDVGNDLIYGSTPEQVAGWVEDCCRRLADRRAEIVLTLLPMASVARLSAWRYYVTRTLFFPGSGPAWNVMKARATELNERLRELGRRVSAHIVEPPGDWYGFDPIHVRRATRDTAWQQILSGWASFNPTHKGSRVSPITGLRLLSLPPAERRLFGRQQQMAQPAFRLGQLSIGLY